ncbi:MAG: hypothetical protein LW875_11550 [Proteobacteria bacterium]|nr:hypothetical protein [Pseudomonadota bacterium]
MKKTDFQQDTSSELDQKIILKVKPQIEKNREIHEAQKRRWFFVWSGVSVAGVLSFLIFRKPPKDFRQEGDDSLAFGQSDQELLFDDELEIAELQEDWDVIELVDELEKEDT